ncbi:MAG: flagellar biosynthetic protein FliO [Thiobacillus sp. 65-29]|jgi:flagellar protein FliO/FliZ|nr:MAG: flagellar biosynthetic protein FliO [Thiobacillus sp. 65-29]
MSVARRGVIGLLAAAPGPVLAQVADGPSTAGSLLQVFVGLIAVLALIVATAWIAKRFGVMRGGSSGPLQVVSSTAVGTRERVVVVEVGESWLIVGVAPGSVNALMTLPRGTAPASSSAIAPGSFAARLQQLIEKRREK